MTPERPDAQAYPIHRSARRWPRRLALVLALTWSLTTMACLGTTIDEITRSPGDYEGQEVTIRGSVVESFSVLGKGAFRVDDGTGSLWVVSEVGVPSEGTEDVRVTGVVSQRLDLEPFGIPVSIGSGPVLTARTLSTGR